MAFNLLGLIVTGRSVISIFKYLSLFTPLFKLSELLFFVLPWDDTTIINGIVCYIHVCIVKVIPIIIWVVFLYLLWICLTKIYTLNNHVSGNYIHICSQFTIIIVWIGNFCVHVCIIIVWMGTFLITVVRRVVFWPDTGDVWISVQI